MNFENMQRITQNQPNTIYDHGLKERSGKQIGRATIRKIINSDMELTLTQNSLKKRIVRHPGMEEELYKFVLFTEDESILSDELLWIKANNLLKEKKPDTSVSLSWVQRFKSRYNIKRRTCHGEAGSVDNLNIDKYRCELQDLIDKYAPQDGPTFFLIG